MAIYIARVELHGIFDEEQERKQSGKVYDRLHLEMEKRGFELTIEKGVGTYELPTATYAYTKDDVPNVERIKGKAMEAGTKTGEAFPKLTDYKFSILIIEAHSINQIALHNL